MKEYKIAVIPGDDIGPEIVPAIACEYRTCVKSLVLFLLPKTGKCILFFDEQEICCNVANSQFVAFYD